MWAINQSIMQQQDLDRRIAEGKTEALGYLDKGQTSSLGEIDKGEAASLGYVDQGYDRAGERYGEARDLYTPYRESGLKALTSYEDTLGLNGEAGATRAADSFHASPGFTKRVDLATDAVARAASATGALGSGNTLQGQVDRAYMLGDQEYSGWQDRLKGVSDQGYNATGAMATLTKGLGDLDVNRGTSKAGIASGAATSRAGIYGTMAAQRAGITQGSTQMGVSSAQNTNSNVIGAGTGAMMAGQQAQANGWGAILGGANALANGLGSAFGGGKGGGWMSGARSLLMGA